MYWSLMNKEKIDRYQGEKIDSKIDKCMKKYIWLSPFKWNYEENWYG